MKTMINKKRLMLSIYIVLGVILIGGLYYFVLINHFFSIPCVFYELTGYYCPGCGITRVFLTLVQLNFYQAFRYNPLIFTMTPFFITYGILYYKNWLCNKRSLIVTDKIWYALLILTVLFGVLRNIDLFSYLAPTVI